MLEGESLVLTMQRSLWVNIISLLKVLSPIPLRESRSAQSLREPVVLNLVGSHTKNTIQIAEKVAHDVKARRRQNCGQSIWLYV